MRRTKGTKPTMKRTSRKMRRTRKKARWFIGMDYLPNRFGFIAGPWEDEKDALFYQAKMNDCVLRQEPSGELFLKWRWKGTNWRKEEPERKVKYFKKN